MRHARHLDAIAHQLARLKAELAGDDTELRLRSLEAAVIELLGRIEKMEKGQ